MSRGVRPGHRRRDRRRLAARRPGQRHAVPRLGPPGRDTPSRRGRQPVAVAGDGAQDLPRPGRLRARRRSPRQRPGARGCRPAARMSARWSASTCVRWSSDDDHVHAEVQRRRPLRQRLAEREPGRPRGRRDPFGDTVELRCNGRTVAVPFTRDVRRCAARSAHAVRGLVPRDHAVGQRRPRQPGAAGRDAGRPWSSRGCRSRFRARRASADPSSRSGHSVYDRRMTARVVLVTGVSRYLGGRLAAQLSADPSIERVIGVDVVPPTTDVGRTEFVRADIRNPIIAKVIASAEVDTVAHLSVIATPFGAGGRAAMKEINVIGTMQLLAACQKAPSVQQAGREVDDRGLRLVRPRPGAVHREHGAARAAALRLRQGLRRGRGLRPRVRPPPPRRRRHPAAVRQLHRPAASTPR